MRAALRSVAAREDEGAYRQQDGLQPQNSRVHHADRVDHVQADALERAEIGRLQLVVVAGIGVDDTAAPWCEGVEAVLESGSR
jgi:phosphoglycerate dehydrogenase-like enzyme